MSESASKYHRLSWPEGFAGCPQPRALAKDIHGHCKGQDNQLHDADPRVYRLGTISLDPAGDKQAEDEAVKDVFAEAEGDEGLAGELAVAVDTEGDGCG